MDSSTVINKLEENGWRLVRIKGSHHYFRKEWFQRPTCVPHPKKDLGKKLISMISNQTKIELK